MRLSVCVMADIDEMDFYPHVESLGYDSAWVADITNQGVVHLLIPGRGEIALNAPLRVGETVKAYAMRVLGEALPVRGDRRWLEVEIVHVENGDGAVIPCIRTDDA